MEKFLQDLFANQQYDENNFFLLAGPCVVESEELLSEVAEKVAAICKNLDIPYVFKYSIRNANRTIVEARRRLHQESLPAIANLAAAVQYAIEYKKALRREAQTADTGCG